MHDPMRGIHPESAELQRFADGESRDPQIAGHIESCARCRDEIAAVRRVTAALSLGSKVPDSLAARIQARRSGSAGAASSRPLARPRPRMRSLMLPLGLAAAALLVFFVPRAVRRPPSEPGSAGVGAKGSPPAYIGLFETIVTEVGPGSIDSMSFSIAAPGIVVELRYVDGRSESPKARRLADRVAGLFRSEGVDASAITVGAEPPGSSLAAGAVRVTVRWQVQPGG